MKKFGKLHVDRSAIILNKSSSGSLVSTKYDCTFWLFRELKILKKLSTLMQDLAEIMRRLTTCNYGYFCDPKIDFQFIAGFIRICHFVCECWFWPILEFTQLNPVIVRIQKQQKNFSTCNIEMGLKCHPRCGKTLEKFLISCSHSFRTYWVWSGQNLTKFKIGHSKFKIHQIISCEVSK